MTAKVPLSVLIPVRNEISNIHDCISFVSFADEIVGIDLHSTDAFVGPGVSIGEGAVVGARAVAVKDVEPWTVVGGNPAKSLGQRVTEEKLSQIKSEGKSA